MIIVTINRNKTNSSTTNSRVSIRRISSSSSNSIKESTSMVLIGTCDVHECSNGEISNSMRRTVSGIRRLLLVLSMAVLTMQNVSIFVCAADYSNTNNRLPGSDVSGSHTSSFRHQRRSLSSAHSHKPRRRKRQEKNRFLFGSGIGSIGRSRTPDNDDYDEEEDEEKQRQERHHKKIQKFFSGGGGYYYDQLIQKRQNDPRQQNHGLLSGGDVGYAEQQDQPQQQGEESEEGSILMNTDSEQEEQDGLLDPEAVAYQKDHEQKEDVEKQRLLQNEHAADFPQNQGKESFYDNNVEARQQQPQQNEQQENPYIRRQRQQESYDNDMREQLQHPEQLYAHQYFSGGAGTNDGVPEDDESNNMYTSNNNNWNNDTSSPYAKMVMEKYPYQYSPDDDIHTNVLKRRIVKTRIGRVLFQAFKVRLLATFLPAILSFYLRGKRCQQQLQLSNIDSSSASGPFPLLSWFEMYLLSLSGASAGFHFFLYFISVGYALGITLPILASLTVHYKPLREAVTLAKTATETSVAASASSATTSALLHTFLVLVWGIRILSFYIWREYRNWPALHEKIIQVQESSPPAKQVQMLIWILYSFVYTSMMTPCWLRLQKTLTSITTATASTVIQQQQGKSSPWFSSLPIWLQIIGISLESIADYQKSMYKQDFGRYEFCNIGLWKFFTHPNYLGEWMFWTGTLLGGGSIIQPHKKRRYVFCVLSLLGYSFISTVLQQAINSLDKKHYDKYGHLDSFIQFRARFGLWGPNKHVYKDFFSEKILFNFSKTRRQNRNRKHRVRAGTGTAASEATTTSE